MRVRTPGRAGAIAALLSGLGAMAARPAAAAEQAYTLLGPGGAASVRVLTQAPACPVLSVDGRPVATTLRAAPATLPPRPTASGPELSKPSVFDSRVCEATLAPGVARVTLDGRALPLAPPLIRRIVVIGDTGCRLKAASDAYQACNDPARFPFAEIAASAARTHPDVVLHVGDYLYRETPCPAGNAGCAGSPWGYGEDAWRADLLGPAAPLLGVAPWIMVRGNHETCERAGQGWWRLFGPGALTPRRDCIDPADDATGDHSVPYAVPLDPVTQVVVWDSAAASGKPVTGPDDPHVQAYLQTARAAEALAAARPHTFMADHHPLLAFAAKAGRDGTVKLLPGFASLQTAFAAAAPPAADGALAPPQADLLLSGHVHVEEALSFGGHEPAQLVTGFSGTEEDTVPLPARLSGDEQPAPGARVSDFSSWVDGFGFAVLDRQGDGVWRVSIRDAAGTERNVCTLQGRRLHCRAEQIPSRYSGERRVQPLPAPAPS